MTVTVAHPAAVADASIQRAAKQALLRRRIATGLVLAVIAVLLYGFFTPDYRQGENSLNGKPAKDFSLILNGKPAHLSDLRGKVVVLNFWATWCPPCVDETPSLNELQAKIAPEGGVVLGVSVDDDAQAYQAFLKNNGVIFPTFRDDSKTIAANYGTSRFPETYLIDRQGRIERKIIGSQDWTSGDISVYIQSLLLQR
jgi:cytochrome c biogenesis protein CcmG/thiol:disulfide interchange protein DsbE